MRTRSPLVRKKEKTHDSGLLTRMLFLMRLAREWELRFENLLRTGGIGKWYSAIGNEALTVGAGIALSPGDALVTLHRDVGAIAARCLDHDALYDDVVMGDSATPGARSARDYLYRLACHMIGRADGFTNGVERSYHFGEIDEDRGLIHVGMVSHLGAMIPVAAGLALAQTFRSKVSQKGQNGDALRVSLNFIGDGGTSTGDFHEALNMAAVWKLPFILVIENNRYAFSTPANEQYACEALADRGVGYGIPSFVVDGNDAIAVHESMVEAIARARRGEGPTLLEARVGRMRGHAEGDGSIDAVPDEERKAYQTADPLPTFERRLIRSGVVDEDFVENLRASIHELMIDVTDRARAASPPDPEKVLGQRSVFAVSEPIIETPVVDSQSSTSDCAELTYLEAIQRGLREEMRADPSVFLMGQDIAEFGGAFRMTSGFLEEFGKERVRNTPIAESGTIGIGVGSAYLGLRPVIEMQFADFISNGFSQVVNVAAKTYYRWQAPVPLVIRCPCGGGAGGGPFHSQNPEAWFAHVPGLKVVTPAFARDALGLIRAAIRDPNPVLFFEHKYLYRRLRESVPDGDILVPIGKARIVRSGNDVSVIAYSWMVHHALEAAQQLEAEGVSVEVIDLRSLVPFDFQTVFESIARTNRAIVVHEATATCGFGAEIAARIVAEAFEYLDAPVPRVTCPDNPIPYDGGLEAACIPDAERIADELRRLVRY